ncbi:hypothetical protein [Arsukibacterium perlucidum]|uniref:hypothetical protein n=1 Tax=Arsukibacterium perlucidum TaxID=368811 RepID=UPI00037F067D|nr:hypothetical protein [Arsukibacterium perlucidum]
MTEGCSSLKKTEDTFVDDLFDAIESLNETMVDSFYLLKEQNRLLVYPLLDLTVESVENKLVLHIGNRGTHTAFNVEVISVISYDTSKKNVSTFFKKHAPGVSANSESCVGAANYISYRLLPQKKAIRVPLDTPLAASSVHVFVQLADVSGNNYQQSYWFFNDNLERSAVFKLGALYPEIPEVGPRITRPELDSETLSHGGDVDEFVSSEFISIYKASSPGSIMCGTDREIEDRGSWYELKS